MSIDVFIVVGFLLINLTIGLYYGSKIKNISDYSIGSRNFNTSTLSATIIATWIGGGFFASALSETYKEGLWHIFAQTGDVLTLLIVGYFIAPRVKIFFGNFSVADTMGKLYGKNIKIITSVASIASTIGSVTVQIKLLSVLFGYFLSFSSIYAVLISSFIVVIYSSFGGIKSVTFTDVVQFITFGIFLPGIAIITWNMFDTPSGNVIEFIKSSPLFDYKQVFDYHDPKFYASIALFLYYTIPGLDPATFHRILLAKDTNQVRNSFIISAILCMFVAGLACTIGVIVLSHNPNLNPDNLVMYLIDNYSYPGLKGLTLIGIMAMIMSTADSYLHSGAVIFSHDFCKSLGIKKFDELLIARVFAFIAGIFAIILALSANNLFQLLLLVGNFYTPIITMPLMLAIFGFRTTPRVVICAMFAGLSTVVVWRIFVQPYIDIDSIIPGTLVNLCTMLFLNYLFKGSKESLTSKDDKINKVKSSKSLLDYIKTFELLKYYKKFQPQSSEIYIYFALIALLNLVSSFTIDKFIYQLNISILGLIQFMVLLISTSIFCTTLWPKAFKEKYLGIIWFLSVFISLIFISSFLVLISEFSHISLIILTIHLILVPLLIGWRASLVMIPLGLWLSFFLYKNFIGEMNPGGIYNLKLKLMYLLFIVMGFAITILKSKQEEQEATEAKVDTLEEEVADLNEKVVHYSERVEGQSKEIERLGATAQRILNNVNHELRLPVGNVMNFAEMLNDGLGKFNEKQLKMLSDEVYQNSNRLSSMIMNMLDLATLEAKKIELNKSTINFGELVRDRVQSCRKMYLGDKKIDFEMQIEEDVLIKVDPNYMRQTVDNLVINAINFSTNGVIRISVLRKGKGVEFIISDNGIGIPKEDLYDIFTPFKMGSNAESKAEGRGVGLALCKAAIEAHGGSISAESKGVGARFRFILI